VLILADYVEHFCYHSININSSQLTGCADVMLCHTGRTQYTVTDRQTDIYLKKKNKRKEEIKARIKTGFFTCHKMTKYN